MASIADLVPQDVPLARVRLRLVDAGPRDGGDGALLLLHGGHGGWRHWVANVPALAERHRVIAPDMPGFGDSGDLDPLSVDSLAATLGELLDQLQLHNVTLAGFSFGCLVATALAGQRPDAIARLLLINPPGIGARSISARETQQEISALSAREGERAGITATLRRLMLCRTELIDDAMVDDALDMARRMRFYTRDVSRAANLLPQLAVLKQPLQVLLGERDPYQCHELAARAERLKQVRGRPVATVVPDAAHWLQRDRADWFNERLSRFARGEPVMNTP
jgi:2-hydroxy-6-oxonona-2,4-dienedioate hydrolase